jgi:hypothetical protein
MDRSTLTLSREEMVESLDRVSNIILNHFTHLQQKPVSRQKTRLELDELIDDAFSADGAKVSKMLSLVESHVLMNIMHLDHPLLSVFDSGIETRCSRQLRLDLLPTGTRWSAQRFSMIKQCSDFVRSTLVPLNPISKTHCYEL